MSYKSNSWFDINNWFERKTAERFVKNILVTKSSYNHLKRAHTQQKQSADLEVQLMQLNHCDGVLSNHLK